MLLALRAPLCLNMAQTKKPLPNKEIEPPKKALSPLDASKKYQDAATTNVTINCIFKNFKAKGRPIANKLVTLWRIY